MMLLNYSDVLHNHPILMVFNRVGYNILTASQVVIANPLANICLLTHPADTEKHT